MYVIDGNTVEGIYQGIIMGNGTEQVSGKINQAISISPSSYIQYEPHQNKCYHNPDVCDMGLTYAMWLWLAPSQSQRDTMILNTGAANLRANGVCVRYDNVAGTLMIQIYNRQNCSTRFCLVESGTWFYLVFSWSEQDSIHCCVNGCSADSNVHIRPQK